jgi:arsenate reductase-like glutaredoxin family protein
MKRILITENQFKNLVSGIIKESLSDTELNKILDKIGDTGIDSLSNHEQTLLKSYSDNNIDVEKEIDKQKNRYKVAKEVIKQIPLKTSDETLEKNLGRYIKFKEDDDRGLIANMGAIYEIIDIQKHWGHNEKGQYVPDMVGYRVAIVGKDNDFGRVGGVDKVIFVNISEDEAIKINIDIFNKLK